ncbi:hypothetical protein XMIN_2882 [Xanthomonas citri pv. mangiferaeindicae LMG 941]|nr:hypothetical protein XMIN_2882 [Xanthomonas citri pv. mangiferaeindicae LMG 941]
MDDAASFASTVNDAISPRSEVGSPPVCQGIDHSALVRLATVAWARRHRVQVRRL